MVERGFGVAALPEIAAGAVAQNGIVQRPLIGPVAERSIGLVTSRSRSLSPAAMALVQVLKEYLAKQARFSCPARAGVDLAQASGSRRSTGDGRWYYPQCTN